MKKLLTILLLFTFEPALADIQRGDTVMEDYQAKSFRTIEAISNNLYYLSDGSWYSSRYVDLLDRF